MDIGKLMTIETLTAQEKKTIRLVLSCFKDIKKDIAVGNSITFYKGYLCGILISTDIDFRIRYRLRMLDLAIAGIEKRRLSKLKRAELSIGGK